MEGVEVWERCGDCKSCDTYNPGAVSWFGYPVIAFNKDGVVDVSVGGATHLSKFGYGGDCIHPHVKAGCLGRHFNLVGDTEIIGVGGSGFGVFCLGNTGDAINKKSYPVENTKLGTFVEEATLKLWKYSWGNDSHNMTKEHWDKVVAYHGFHRRRQNPEFWLDIVYNLLYMPSPHNPFINPKAEFYYDRFDGGKLKTKHGGMCLGREPWATRKFSGFTYWGALTKAFGESPDMRETFKKTNTQNLTPMSFIHEEMEALSQLAKGKPAGIKEKVPDHGRVYNPLSPEANRRSRSDVYVMEELLRIKQYLEDWDWDDEEPDVYGETEFSDDFIVCLTNIGNLSNIDSDFNDIDVIEDLYVIISERAFLSRVVNCDRDHDVTQISLIRQVGFGVFGRDFVKPNHITQIQNEDVLADTPAILKTLTETMGHLPDWVSLEFMDKLSHAENNVRAVGDGRVRYNFYHLLDDLGLNKLGQLRNLCNNVPKEIGSLSQYLIGLHKYDFILADGTRVNNIEVPHRYKEQLTPTLSRRTYDNIINNRTLRDDPMAWVYFYRKLPSDQLGKLQEAGVITYQDFRETALYRYSGILHDNGDIWGNGNCQLGAWAVRLPKFGEYFHPTSASEVEVMPDNLRAELLSWFISRQGSQLSNMRSGWNLMFNPLIPYESKKKLSKLGYHRHKDLIGASPYENADRVVSELCRSSHLYTPKNVINSVIADNATVKSRVKRYIEDSSDWEIFTRTLCGNLGVSPKTAYAIMELQEEVLYVRGRSIPELRESRLIVNIREQIDGLRRTTNCPPGKEPEDIFEIIEAFGIDVIFKHQPTGTIYELMRLIPKDILVRRQRICAEFMSLVPWISKFKTFDEARSNLSESEEKIKLVEEIKL